MEKIWETLWDFFKTQGMRLVYAALVCVVGFVIAKIIVKLITRLLQRSRIPTNSHNLILTVVKIALNVLVLLMTASSLGIDTSGAVAIVGVFSLAASLAVQDTLKNFTGGLQMVTAKPFDIGDYVSIGADSGTVLEIGMIYTTLVTPDNKHIYIPNSQLATATIVNYSSEDTRRLDLVFSIRYEDDYQTAKKVIESLLKDNPLVMQEKSALVRMCAHSDSAIGIAVRVWVKREDYWDLNFALYEEVKAAFDQAGITIPYKQIEIHQTKAE